MTLAAPIWLLAAASVMAPILIHLFGRPRPRLRRFPSLMLLRRAQSERRSTTRLRQLLSLILRCIALVMLAIMMAAPLSGWQLLARLGEQRGATAILLDTSPSMSAAADVRPIERARGAVEALLEALPPGEEVILMAGDRGGSLNREDALRAVQSITVDDRRARLGDAIATLLDAEWSLARIFLLTDGQASSLTPLQWTAPSEARVTVVDVGAELAGNSALIGFRTQNPLCLAGRPGELIVAAQTWGEGIGRAPLRIKCAAEEMSVGIDLLPDAVATATAELVPTDAGALACVARLPEDALAADNTRVFSTLVRPHLRVAVIGSSERTRFIEAALNPFAATDPRSSVELLHADSIGAYENVDVLIVAEDNLAEDDFAPVLAMAEGGAGVLLFADASEAILGALGFAGVTVGAPLRPEQPAALAELSIKRSPLAEFAEPGAGDLSAARFTSVPDVRVAEDSTARVLARYDDGTPALLEGSVGRGRTLFFATSPDGTWGDLVRIPEFVPLMHRMAAHLASGTMPTILAGPPGEPTVGMAFEGQYLRVVDASGQETPVEMADGAWRFTALASGAYRLRSDAEDVAAFAVNVDAAESDPSRLSDAEMRDRLKPLDTEVVAADMLPQFIKRLRAEAADISSLVAFIALLIVAGESVQSLRPRRSADDE